MAAVQSKFLGNVHGNTNGIVGGTNILGVLQLEVVAHLLFCCIAHNSKRGKGVRSWEAKTSNRASAFQRCCSFHQYWISSSFFHMKNTNHIFGYMHKWFCIPKPYNSQVNESKHFICAAHVCVCVYQRRLLDICVCVCVFLFAAIKVSIICLFCGNYSHTTCLRDPFYFEENINAINKWLLNATATTIICIQFTQICCSLCVLHFSNTHPQHFYSI